MAKSTILSSIDEICDNKNLSKEQVLSAIEQALAAAYRKDFGNKQQNIIVEFEPETGNMKVYEEKEVVEDIDEDSDEKRYINRKTEIQLSDAKELGDEWKNTRKNAKKIKVGDVLRKDREIPSNFGRIAAQTAKQVIIQRLRESERETLYEKYKDKQGEILNGIVQRKGNKNIYIDLSDTTAIMPYREQVKDEKYWIDQKLKVYIKEVKETTKGPNIIVSRKHPSILKDLIKTEIPEVANGKVEINAIAREPGSRAKIAVSTDEESIDPIGAIIGQKGIRIQTIINEIGGEKIDVIEYSDEPKEFIKNALAPANIVKLELQEKKKAVAHVKKDQISLAIGKAGQNVRLAAKLTGWKIDVVEAKESKDKSKDKQDKKKSKKNKKDKDESKSKKPKDKKDKKEVEEKESKDNKKKKEKKQGKKNKESKEKSEKKKSKKNKDKDKNKNSKTKKVKNKKQDKEQNKSFKKKKESKKKKSAKENKSEKDNKKNKKNK